MGPCKTQGLNNVIPLNGKTGRLFSPLYPETFPNNMTCTWIIAVTEGHFVRLRITSFSWHMFVSRRLWKFEMARNPPVTYLGIFAGAPLKDRYSPAVVISGFGSILTKMNCCTGRDSMLSSRWSANVSFFFILLL